MAHNRLSEKLDQISGQELGFAYDETLVWSKLEKRLDKGKVRAYWWAVAASLLVAILFLPFSLLKEGKTETTVVSSKEELNVEEPALLEETKPYVRNTAKEHALSEVKKPLVRIGTTPILAELPKKKLYLEPIAITQQDKEKKPLFAAEDISVIQANLEQPSIENGRKMTIRAQWQKSPDELNVNHQTLKIKLYEKHQ